LAIADGVAEGIAKEMLRWSERERERRSRL